MMRRVFVNGVRLVVAFAFALGSGCGEEEQGLKRPPRSKSRAKVASKTSKKAATGNALQFYVKVEDVARGQCPTPGEECDKEVKAIRHRFTTRDFEQDLTGTENRDPFRSYVLRDPGLFSAGDGTQSVKASDGCKKENMRAPNPLAKDAGARASSSLRDLQLKGIVLRGTKSYAVFTDRSSYGHIVKIGDCLGKEKARVSKIGAGFVELEIVQESADGPRPVQKREIALHPEELQFDDLEAE